MKILQRFTRRAFHRAASLALAPLFAFTGANLLFARDQECLVYFGTYTGAKSKGIYVSRLNLASGALTPPALAAEISSPSFLAIHPNHRFLYAVNEVSSFNGKPSGAVSAFAIDVATGKLTFLNQQSSVGAGPCHLVVDAAGKNVLIANYGGGSIASLPLDANGRLSEASAFIQHKGSGANPQRQEGPHAHGIYLDAANRLAFVPDLGQDKLMIYKFDSTKGTLTANEPAFAPLKSGAGPRHFALHPSGHFAYVINEMHCTVTAFENHAGAFKELQTISTLPEGQAVLPSFSTAELEAHPSGKFLYGSNRGHDTIAVFAIDAKTGQLTAVQHQSTLGKIPRGFGIDPTGAFLIAGNQDSHNVVVFRIDPKSGRLTPTGTNVEVGAPVCVKFVPLK